MTFTDQQNLYQQLTQDYSAAGLVIAKRDINEGAAVFLNRLGRKFNKEYQTTGTVASQQYYQLPSEVLRVSEIRVLNGNYYYTPQLVASEHDWNQLNMSVVKSNYPTHYYIRGFNEIGLYPIPSTSVANAIQISYEPQHVDLTQDDFTIGTITVSNGSPNGQTVTHSASGFTPNMVGCWLQVTDGTDGKWYRIGGYTSTSVLTLDNYYEGIAGSGRTFRIGEVMKIPNGYQDAPVYFAAERFYMTENDQRTAPIFNQRFEAKIHSAKETYGRSTSQMGIKRMDRGSGRRLSWIDLTPPIIYPS